MCCRRKKVVEKFGSLADFLYLCNIIKLGYSTLKIRDKGGKLPYAGVYIEYLVKHRI